MRHEKITRINMSDKREDEGDKILMIRFNKLIKPTKNGSLERYLNKIGSISICELG